MRRARERGGARPAATRVRREPTADWQQRRLYVATPEQGAEARLRPVVLFGHATGVAARTRRRKADRRALPPEVRRAILDL